MQWVNLLSLLCHISLEILSKFVVMVFNIVFTSLYLELRKVHTCLCVCVCICAMYMFVCFWSHGRNSEIVLGCFPSFYSLFFKVVCIVVFACGWKKNFQDLNQGVEKTSLLRRETLLTQWGSFLIIRERRLWGHGRVCVYSPRQSARSGLAVHMLTCWLVGEEWSLLIQLLLGWGRMVSWDILAAWLGAYIAP